MILAHSHIYYCQDQTAIPLSAISIPGHGGISPRSVLRRADVMTNDQLLNTSYAWDAQSHSVSSAWWDEKKKKKKKPKYFSLHINIKTAKWSLIQPGNHFPSGKLTHLILQHHSTPMPSVSWAILLRNMKLCRNLSACGLNNYLLFKHFGKHEQRLFTPLIFMFLD